MLSPRELATVLAALRYWQDQMEHLACTEFMAIAKDAGESLNADEISALCERLNCHVCDDDCRSYGCRSRD
jgi:hypothetical protein